MAIDPVVVGARRFQFAADRLVDVGRDSLFFEASSQRARPDGLRAFERPSGSFFGQLQVPAARLVFSGDPSFERRVKRRHVGCVLAIHSGREPLEWGGSRERHGRPICWAVAVLGHKAERVFGRGLKARDRRRLAHAARPGRARAAVVERGSRATRPGAARARVVGEVEVQTARRPFGVQIAAQRRDAVAHVARRIRFRRGRGRPELQDRHVVSGAVRAIDSVRARVDGNSPATLDDMSARALKRRGERFSEWPILCERGAKSDKQVVRRQIDRQRADARYRFRFARQLLFAQSVPPAQASAAEDKIRVIGGVHRQARRGTPLRVELLLLRARRAVLGDVAIFFIRPHVARSIHGDALDRARKRAKPRDVFSFARQLVDHAMPEIAYVHIPIGRVERPARTPAEMGIETRVIDRDIPRR